jgi:hypothetical protein
MGKNANPGIFNLPTEKIISSSQSLSIAQRIQQISPLSPA